MDELDRQHPLAGRVYRRAADRDDSAHTNNSSHTDARRPDTTGGARQSNANTALVGSDGIAYATPLRAVSYPSAGRASL
jgi:hypothetical protein